VILQQIEDETGKVMSGVKMRGSEHSVQLSLYDVAKHGLTADAGLDDYRGTITGFVQPNRRRRGRDGLSRAWP
jgi:hypothetical protein